MNSTNLNTAHILMVSYHIEQITKSEYLSEFNSIVIYKKGKEEQTCEQMMILLESKKVIDFSKFNISMN